MMRPEKVKGLVRDCRGSSPTVPQVLRSPDSTRFPLAVGPSSFSEAEGVVEAVQWFKDGVEMSGETSPTLVIPEVSLADEGDYSVEVTNSSGSAVSAGNLDH